MDQETIKFKLPKLSSEKSRRKNEMNTDKKKMKEFIRTSTVFPIKKINSGIFGVFSRKKTLAGENRGQRDDSTEKTNESAGEAVLGGKVNPKQNLLHKKRFWERARTRLKILILGQRLKKTRRRKCLNESPEEDELCKKRILMGERCIPMNKSGVLQYDDDGILLPEP